MLKGSVRLRVPVAKGLPITPDGSLSAAGLGEVVVCGVGPFWRSGDPKTTAALRLGGAGLAESTAAWPCSDGVAQTAKAERARTVRES